MSEVEKLQARIAKLREALQVYDNALEYEWDVKWPFFKRGMDARWSHMVVPARNALKQDDLDALSREHVKGLGESKHSAGHATIDMKTDLKTQASELFDILTLDFADKLKKILRDHM